MNPYKDIEDNTFTAPPHLAYEDIATKLLKDRYFLTALELHTELVENGNELPQLREFFSNPGNFEQHVCRPSDIGSMHRTPSQATLDSLDTARYSEDGGGDRVGSGNDVAVLEFELRKARETINALRANLTQFADSESALDKNSKDNSDQRSLKPHEKRALNFLINEYLLLQNYKLTSITFSDENPDQEFEDWDDVGLNMPRPAGLVSMFRGNKGALKVQTADAYTQNEMSDVTDAVCQTEVEYENVCVSCQTSLDNDSDWNHELLIQAEEIELLKQKVIALETEKLNFQKLYDAAIVSLNSLTSPSIESKTLELQMPGDKLQSAQATPQHERPITCTAAENHYGSGQSTNSATPDQFEMIESEKNLGIKKEGSNTSSFDPAILDNSARGSPLRRGSVTTLDETLSMNDAGDWTRVHYEYTIENSTKEMWIDSGIPDSIKDPLLNWCSETLNLNEPLTNDLLAELVNSEKPISLPGLLMLVAETLPRVVPHTLVSRRGEAAALLAAAAALLPAAADASRARLLHTLITLVKKPEPADTRIICDAVCLVVKWGGAAEVLSSVAELLTSKSSERRVLASQICVAIAPYVPVELCTSLLLSLVMLMCESGEPEIRGLGLRAACLICLVSDHKYEQLEKIMFTFLKDPVEKNVRDTVNVFVPVLARSALLAGKFVSDLCDRVITNLTKCSTENEWKGVLLYLECIRALVLAKLAYVINVQIVRDVTLNNCDMKTIKLQEVSLQRAECFVDVQCYMNDSVDATMLLVAMNSLIKDPEVRWTELTWFIDWLRKILETVCNCKVVNHPTVYENLIALFSCYVDNFGFQFAASVIKPIFSDIMGRLERKMEKLDTVNLESMAVVGVYMCTVLITVEESEMRAELLQKWIVYSSLRGLPAKIFSMPLKWLANNKPDILSFFWQHLREFAASSCESSTGNTIRVYIANLLTEMLNVSEVDEDCIEKQLLPAAVALLYDDHVSVREAAIASWGGVTRACVVRHLECSEQCWAPVEELLAPARPLTTREAARLAEALALLVLPTVDNRTVSDQAVSLLCALCHHSALTCDWLAALAPGLQLAVHHYRHHPALLPALRKLEECVQTPQMSQYKPAIEALLHAVGTSHTADVPREHIKPATNLQTAQEVGRRVTQIFQQSKTNMNLQNIFKKKT